MIAVPDAADQIFNFRLAFCMITDARRRVGTLLFLADLIKTVLDVAAIGSDLMHVILLQVANLATFLYLLDTFLWYSVSHAF